MRADDGGKDTTRGSEDATKKEDSEEEVSAILVGSPGSSVNLLRSSAVTTVLYYENGCKVIPIITRDEERHECASIAARVGIG